MILIFYVIYEFNANKKRDIFLMKGVFTFCG